jgi:hypothetical protein
MSVGRAVVAVLAATTLAAGCTIEEEPETTTVGAGSIKEIDSVRGA